MIVDKLEDTLGGGYNGLRGEIEDVDEYRMRDVADIVSKNNPLHIFQKGHKRKFNFEPTIVFDLGANVGIFSRYVKRLYPSCRVVAVEPNPENVTHFKKFTDLSDPFAINLQEKAIGLGKVLHRNYGAINGAHETYLTESNNVILTNGAGFDDTEIKCIMPDQLIALFTYKYVEGSRERVVMKIDIEGNESVIFDHPPSMQALKLVDYLVIELHWMENPEIKAKALRAIEQLKETHDVEYEHIYLYAVKR